jgi:hypothetical protein
MISLRGSRAREARKIEEHARDVRPIMPRAWISETIERDRERVCDETRAPVPLDRVVLTDQGLTPLRITSALSHDIPKRRRDDLPIMRGIYEEPRFAVALREI